MHASRFLMVASAAILVSAGAFGQSAMDTVFQVHYFSNLSSSLPAGGATLGATDTVVNVTDTGASIGTTFAINSGGPVLSNASGPCSPSNPCSSAYPASVPTSVVGNGNLCINAYVFSPNEELQACCTCFLTPNGLGSFDAVTNLLANTTDGLAVPSGVIKLVATLGGATAATSGCDATLAGQPLNTFNTLTGKAQAATNSVLAPGMLAWARGQISGSSAGVETAFSPATLSSGNGTTSYTISAATGAYTQVGGVSELNRMTGQCAGLISGLGICKGCTTGGL
jgi:hypothetical protein